MGIQLLMIGSYVGALHAPEPRDVPIAVVGPRALTAPALAKLRVGGVLSPRSVPDLEAAQRAIDRREVYAALIPGRSADRLVVAPAASASVAELLPVALRKLEPAGRRLSVQTVKPLPANDPLGLSSRLPARTGCGTRGAFRSARSPSHNPSPLLRERPMTRSCESS